MTEEEKKQQQQQQAAAQQPAQAVQPTDPVPAPPQQQEEPQQEPYTSELDKLLQTYDRRKAADDAANRRSRVSEAIAGIGDVARAVSNLYHTTQYAPYVPSDNISDTLRTRNDRLTALRDKNRDQWMHYVLNVAGKKEQSRQAQRAQEATQAYHNALLEERRETARINAEDRKRREDERKEQADAKAWARSYAKKWEAAAINGTLDPDTAEKWIEEQPVSDTHKTAARYALREAMGTAQIKKNQYIFNQQHKTSAGGGSAQSSGLQFTTHIPGETITWPKSKKDEQNLSQIYFQLPKKEQSFGRKPSATQMRSAIGHFFVSSEWTPVAKEEIRKKMIAIRDADQEAQPSQQSKQQDSGKTTKYSHTKALDL